MPHSSWYTGFSLNSSDSYTVTSCKQGGCYHGDPLGFLGVDPAGLFFFFFWSKAFFDVLDLAIQKAWFNFFLQQAIFKKYYHVVYNAEEISETVSVTLLQKNKIYSSLNLPPFIKTNKYKFNSFSDLCILFLSRSPFCIQ